jgi:hypothetical protein
MAKKRGKKAKKGKKGGEKKGKKPVAPGWDSLCRRI